MITLKVRLSRIAENARRVRDFCARRGIGVTAVTKGVCACPEIMRVFWESGYRSFADSRLENIRELRKLCPEAEITLIRPPLLSEIPELPLWADNILVSMSECLSPLDAASGAAGRALGIMLIIEMGDLRDGIMPDEAGAFASAVASFKNLKLRGIAANFACLSGALPSRDKLERLAEIKRGLEAAGHEGLICSGGSTSSLPLLERGEMPEGVDRLRVGEAILLGTDVAHGCAIDWLNRDTMVLEAELIEIRRKPSDPSGEYRLRGGRKPRLRGIAALGTQDVDVSGLEPLLEGAVVLGASSDHLALGLESAAESDVPRYGDTLEFAVDYHAMLTLFNSFSREGFRNSCGLIFD